jgi:UDP-N-acetyl-alpha-D-muramoyl-L-alanyl-L-glutamate epimerase
VTRSEIAEPPSTLTAVTDAAAPLSSNASFHPSEFRAFRFLDRSIDHDGLIRLRYGLDDSYVFEERFEVPVPQSWDDVDEAAVERLLALLHWVAGVSYYKTAAPPTVEIAGPLPGPGAAALLEALYSEGLGEFAVVAGLDQLPRPSFPSLSVETTAVAPLEPTRVLVPVGGGKDSAVAIEIVRRSGLGTGLFSIGGASAIERTVQAAELPWLQVRRHLDPQLAHLNRSGALNGHVPVTAIVSCVALIVAALHGFDAVALANERSASAGNRLFDGVEVNHQFSKSARAERLLRDAVAEATPRHQIFSVLRPASELAIARAFARLPQYHAAFTSCNRIFQLEKAKRLEHWCCSCDKCRFVFLILAPFLAPTELRSIFGTDMLAEQEQFPGFALLTGTGGHKPFECVGEIEESVAAIRMLAEERRWNGDPVVERLVREVLPRFRSTDGDPETTMRLSDEHSIPSSLIGSVDALLGA